MHGHIRLLHSPLAKSASICVPTALAPLEWQAEEVCSVYATWMCDSCGYSKKQAHKKVRINKVPGPENVADANTKPADRRSLEFCHTSMGVTEIPKQLRDTVLWHARSLCVTAHGSTVKMAGTVLAMAAAASARVLTLFDVYDVVPY